MSTWGLSSSRTRRMHDVLNGYVERGEVPGLVTVVGRRGDVHVDCIGYERDAIFRVASMTKVVTAAAAMILVEEAAIHLADPVGDLVPEMANPRVLRTLESPVADTVPADRPITVADLLTFTLGTGVVFARPGTYPIQESHDASSLFGGAVKKPPAGEFLRRLAGLPLVHQPGHSWMYNTGSDVLGILIERLTGRPFGEFLRERIFEPLDMNDTGFSVPPGSFDRLPAAYAPEAAGLRIEDKAGRDSAFARPPALESGAGGLVSTVDDWLAFASMLLGRGSLGGTRILSRPAVETMTMDHLTADQKARSPWVPGFFETHGWGFGVSVVTARYDIQSTRGKYGWEGGFGTSWYNDPAEQMITIVMTQVSMTSPVPDAVVRDFWTLAYAAIDD